MSSKQPLCTQASSLTFASLFLCACTDVSADPGARGLHLFEDCYEPNQLGMYDVFSKLSEWTEDCHGFTSENAPTDCSARQLEPHATRVLKSGSRAGGPGYLRPAIRTRVPIALRGDGHSLRVVHEL